MFIINYGFVHWFGCSLPFIYIYILYIYIERERERERERFYFSFFSFCECVSVCFFLWFCLLSLAFTICPRVLSIWFIVFIFVFCFRFCLFLFFWALWLAGSWCTGRVLGQSLWGGRYKSNTLDLQTYWPHIISIGKSSPRHLHLTLRTSSTQWPASSSALCPMPKNKQNRNTTPPISSEVA